MSYMFSYCSNLKILDLSSFNTLNVTNLSYMFYNCENLNNLDLSSFNCTNITNAVGLFHGCQNNLQNIINLYLKNIMMTFC